ncbi:sodium:sulfate symporter transmembrane component [Actinomyces sp. oral taxon 448 str. F0400]|nr:sodium:sulfate symporter transmembrane component [Actinomyces sp. oral taxon 448 str. F0400]
MRPVPRRAAPLRAPPDAVSAVIGAADPEEAAGVTETGRRLTAAAAVLRGVWWMTEAVPLPATALVPLVLFPSHRLPQGRPRRHHRLRSVDAHGGASGRRPGPIPPAGSGPPRSASA